ncbi:MAG TPA: Mut7-C RNAse domain-containing protein [Thermoplasmata archaeon]|nr:Mut7-C RNAse domain-containing protein [Thermoplasmata archaeon]
MASPAWLVDEMLGRLARYLRILGCDAEYVRGLSDDELLQHQRRSERVLLTRDVALARRSERAQLLRAVDVRAQLVELWRAWPALPRVPRFDRCTECNGPLVTVPPGEAGNSTGGSPQFRCTACGHRYWAGSHTAHLERDLAEWSREVRE